MKNIDYSNITHISKVASNCHENSVYFCFKGQKNDGHDYISQALENNVAFIVGTKDLAIDNYYQVADINQEFVRASQEVNDFKDNKLKFVGVTGTDGKTSVTTLVDKILNKLSTSAYLGTSGLIINRKELEYSGMTTPFADQLYAGIKEANQSSEYFVMEVSSHALDQERIAGLMFDVIGLTNLTSDHLDYHLTVENYLNAKLKIFNHLKAGKKAVVNIDDHNYNYLKNQDNVVSISMNEQADYKISDVKLSLDETSYILTVDNVKYNIHTPLLAEFNIYNLVMAIAIVVNLGYNIDDVLNSCQDIYVEGRLQLLKNEQYPNVIFDFAHTPDSIFKIMEFLDSIKEEQKIWVVCGTAGERDSLKRPEMGQAASQHADYLILTEDDPRSESVSDINNQLREGITNDQCQVMEILSRPKAISYALEHGSKDDLVVLLGKSGQKKMYYDGYETAYDEEQVVQNILQGVKNERY